MLNLKTIHSVFIKDQSLKHKQMDLGFLCVCLVIDHEFRHNIVKVAVDPQCDGRVDLQTTLAML